MSIVFTDRNLKNTSEKYVLARNKSEKLFNVNPGGRPLGSSLSPGWSQWSCSGGLWTRGRKQVATKPKKLKNLNPKNLAKPNLI